MVLDAKSFRGGVRKFIFINSHGSWERKHNMISGQQCAQSTILATCGGVAWIQLRGVLFVCQIIVMSSGSMLDSTLNDLMPRSSVCYLCILVSLVLMSISWPATMWGPAIVMVCVVHPSVFLSHMNISKTQRDRCMITRKLE